MRLKIIKNNDTGLVFEKDDPRDLARKILLILQDEALRHRVIANGINWAKNNFGVEKMVTGIESYYRAQLGT